MGRFQPFTVVRKAVIILRLIPLAVPASCFFGSGRFAHFLFVLWIYTRYLNKRLLASATSS